LWQPGDQVGLVVDEDLPGGAREREAPGTTGLEAEFERLECVANWVEPTVAQTERNGMRGIVTIYPNPAALTDLDGAPLFPGVAPGHVVVKMLAL